MRNEKIVISKLHVTRLILMLCISAFLTSCSTSMVDLQTDAQVPDPSNAIVVGSFLLEPVPQWEAVADNYWLSIWKSPVPRSEYTITLQPNKKKDTLIQLPAGIYEIYAIYEGKQSAMSRGHSRVGGLGLWFELKEGEITYIGDLKLTISPDNAYLRRQRDEAVDDATRIITKTFLGTEISGTPSRPKMYSVIVVGDNLAGTIDKLRSKGWSDSSIAKLKKYLITTEAIK